LEVIIIKPVILKEFGVAAVVKDGKAFIATLNENGDFDEFEEIKNTYIANSKLIREINRVFGTEFSHGALWAPTPNLK